MSEYHDALYLCYGRYVEMAIEGGISSKDPLWIFICEYGNACLKKLPVPKLCRWLGYIQGCLIERGFTTVDAERDFTRPLFRPLDFS